jgi:dynactin complex subunit
MKMDGLQVGTRLQVDKHSATVRYVGEVAGQEGIWVGLEWDDASRGKHNGSYKEKDYFSCLGNRASGSFVRQNKLLAVADLGIALTEALAER